MHYLFVTNIINLDLDVLACFVMFAMCSALSHRVGTLRTAIIIIIFIQCNTVTCTV